MILILSTGLACLVLLGWRRWLSYCQRVEADKLAYLKVLKALRHLFEFLPQHRGMANAYLQGDDSFKSKLESVAQQIQHDLSVVETAISFNDNEVMAQRWETIKSDWGQLKSSVMTLSPPQSFTKHTELIQQVLYLMGDSARYLVASDDGAKNTNLLSNMLFSDMPQMMEFIGRARGIGTGVASSGVLSVANRVKLCFLHAGAQERLRVCEAASARTLNSHEYSAYRNKATVSHQNTAAFIDLLKSDLLDVDKISIQPGNYYDAGTVAIGASLGLMDDLMPLLEQQLTIAAKKVLQQRLMFMGISIISLMGFVVAWVTL